MATTWLSADDVRSRWGRGYPETAKALLAALGSGWRLSAQGHGGRLYCPVEHDPLHRRHQFSVNGTPKSDGREARRVGRELRVCKANEQD